MYKTTKIGYIIGDDPYYTIKKTFRITYESKHWVIWCAVITPATCYYCASMNGRILSPDDPRVWDIPVHPNCNCYIEAVIAIVAGTATNRGTDGVDLYVALCGSLPDYYLTQADAKRQG